MQERAFLSSVGTSKLSESFRSTVWIGSSFADAYLLVLTRSTARFRYMQELHRNYNWKCIPIDMIILFVSSLPTDMNSFSRYVGKEDTQVKRSLCGTLPCKLQEYMEDFSSVKAPLESQFQ